MAGVLLDGVVLAVAAVAVPALASADGLASALDDALVTGLGTGVVADGETGLAG